MARRLSGTKKESAAPFAGTGFTVKPNSVPMTVLQSIKAERRFVQYAAGNFMPNMRARLIVPTFAEPKKTVRTVQSKRNAGLKPAEHFLPCLP